MTRTSSRTMRLAIAAVVMLLALLAARVARGDVPVALVLLFAPLAAWWTIPAGLLVELPVLWRWFDMSWGRAIAADLLMNAVSTLVGLLLVPVLFASLYQLPAIVPRGVFEAVLTPLLFVLINTFVEYGVLRVAFGSRWTWTRAGMLYAANFASVTIIFLGLVLMSGSQP